MIPNLYCRPARNVGESGGGCSSKIKSEDYVRGEHGKGFGILHLPHYPPDMFDFYDDFTLPYDLYWLHKNNMLSRPELVPSWNYKRVRSSKSTHSILN